MLPETRRTLVFRAASGAAALPRGRAARLRANHGFTLLELSIVLFIMGLVIALAMPHFGGLPSAHLKSESRRLAGRATYLYQRATSDRMLMRLTFDLDTNSYYVSRLDPYANEPLFQQDSQPGLAPVLMPIGVRLRDVTVEGIGTITRGTANCMFYPEGYVDATVVHLMDDSGTIFTLSFNPSSGRVAIRNGDIGAAPALAMGQ